MNRRVGFFAVAALVCFAMVPVLDSKFQWVPKAVGLLYIVLTLLAALDAFGRRRL
ncbi:MAG: hypothetical protein QOE45_894 [Frankiaceae bacterium]|nr:hypothetical protein [Frankiaceae bacterium]